MLRQIRLHGRGAGIRFKKTAGPLHAPRSRGHRHLVHPRRAGKIKLWATIGGKRTNTVRMKVLRKRC